MRTISATRHAMSIADCREHPSVHVAHGGEFGLQHVLLLDGGSPWGQRAAPGRCPSPRARPVQDRLDRRQRERSALLHGDPAVGLRSASAFARSVAGRRGRIAGPSGSVIGLFIFSSLFYRRKILFVEANGWADLTIYGMILRQTKLILFFRAPPHRDAVDKTILLIISHFESLSAFARRARPPLPRPQG